MPVLSRWIRQAAPVVPISCNLSRPSFQDTSYLSELLEIYRRYSIPQSLLELELSEEIELAAKFRCWIIYERNSRISDFLVPWMISDQVIRR